MNADSFYAHDSTGKEVTPNASVYSGMRAEVTAGKGQRSEVRKGVGLLIMLPSISPISALKAVSALGCWAVMELQYGDQTGVV